MEPWGPCCSAELTAADFGGPELEGCNENLVLTRPDVISDIHRAYYEAGSDIVETDSFRFDEDRSRRVRAEDKSYELNFTAAKLARQVADELWRPGRPRFVAGSMGPNNESHLGYRRRHFPGTDGELLRPVEGAP